MRMHTVSKEITLVISFVMFAAGLAQAQQFNGGLTFKRLFLDYQTLNDGDFGAFRDLHRWP